MCLRAGDIWLGSNVAFELMLLLCGVNVPLDGLPPALAVLGQGLPLTHGIAAARDLVAGAAIDQVSELIGTEAVIGAAYGVLGYGLLRLFEAEARRRASLDTR